MSYLWLDLQLNGITGIHITFFLFAIYTLSHRWKTPGIKLLVVASCVLAVLGTTQLAVNLAMTVATARFVQKVLHAEILNQSDFLLPLARVQSFAFVINM